MVKLNRRIAALRPSATMAATTRAIEMRAAGISVISLAAGEPDCDTPERIKEAARRALAAGKTKYTPVGGVRELKEAIRLKFKRDNQLDYEISEIIASAGCKQAEANVIAALFDEGDEVIIPTPAWVSFAAMVELSGATPKMVPCPENKGFLLAPDQLRKAITARTRGIILNSPSNPTGAVYNASELADLAKVLLDARIWVISDDCYESMSYEGAVPHIFHIEPRLKEYGIAANSLSKTYSMTGWRLGYLGGPKEVIAAVLRLQGQNSGNPTSFVQMAGIEALTGPQDDVAAMVEEFRKRRALVVERIHATPGFSMPNVPAGAFYALVNVSALLGSTYKGRKIDTGDQLSEFLLEEAHVATVGGTDFGAPEYIRLSYAASTQNLNDAFDRIGSALKKLGQ